MPCRIGNFRKLSTETRVEARGRRLAPLFCQYQLLGIRRPTGETGTTLGRAHVWLLRQPGGRLISVVLNSNDRWGFRPFIDYGFNDFSLLPLPSRGKVGEARVTEGYWTGYQLYLSVIGMLCPGRKGGGERVDLRKTWQHPERGSRGNQSHPGR